MRNFSYLIKTLLLILLLTIPSASLLKTQLQLNNYQQFWLWGGVKTTPLLKHAQRLYILQGRIIERRQQLIFQRQGLPALQNLTAELILVYRLETLAWNELLRARILNHIQSWQYRGNHVIGIQLDFDANTKGLFAYEQFLKKVRASLPPQYQLSITGLLDWTRNADVQVLNALQQTVDEVIFQTYQGRHSINNYELYLKSLLKLKLPFKVGIVERGLWRKEYEFLLASSPYYAGIVVFLLA
ncbi:MAG: DUF3142 domain-containing protein [Methylococcaceae bacterium]